MYLPLGLSYLAAYASGRAVYPEFAYAEGADDILAEEPDVIGTSATTENYPLAVETASRLRERFCGPLMIDGVHVSALPGSLPQR